MAVQAREDIIFDIPEKPFAIRLPFKLSDDELLALSSLNTEVQLEVSAQGDLIVMPPAGGESSHRNANINSQLFAWAQKDGTGRVYDSSGGFRLPNDALRSPDASWVSKERLEPLSAEQREKYLPLCPDFVIELMSLDSLKAAQQKMLEYIDNGTELGWLIDVKRQRAYAYTSEGVRELEAPDSLEASPVLGGFVLDLREIW